jgi:hypothetical protein
VKTHKIFKKIQHEIDILEEYFKNMETQNLPTGGSHMSQKFGINETVSSFQSKSPTENNPQYQDMEKEAKKVLHRIPANLHKYIGHAINDFYKQVDEYETWKVKVAGVYLNGPQAD